MENSSSEKLRVVAAVADTKKVILYKEDGETLTVSQGDYRLQALMDEIIPITSRGEVAVISLTNFSVYADFQNQVNGIVRFFKTKRQTLAHLKNPTASPDTVITINVEFSSTASKEDVSGLLEEAKEYARPWLEGKTNSQSVNMAVKSQVTSESGEVSEETTITPLSPITDAESEIINENEDLILALVDGVLIPDVDKLRPYIVHSLKHNSTQAVVAFLKRAASVMKEKAHSIVELMEFLKEADLPLAEDGTIIAYKVLNKVSDKPGTFKDPHSGKVIQKVGSVVKMDEKLIDPDRRTQCSTGLHIARRGYLSGFTATDAFLVKVAPEDIVAVPLYTPSKMRVSQYHVIFHLPDDAYTALKANKPMMSNLNAKAILGKAISGHHLPPKEEVLITGSMGEGLVIRSLSNEPSGKGGQETKPTDDRKAESLEEVERGEKIPPKEINKRVREEKAASAKAAKKPAPKANTKAKSAKKIAGDVLTKDQKRVLDSHAKGTSQSEIARKTGISRRTVGRWIDKYGTKTPAS
jgi:hypothetical protein